MNAAARIRTTLIIAVLSLNAFLITSCRFGVSLYLLIHVDLSHAALNAVSVALMTCIAAPLGGIIADKYPPTRLFIALTFCFALLCTGYGFALVAQHNLIAITVTLLGIIFGFFTAFSSPNQKVLMAYSAPAGEKTKFLASMRMWINLSRLAAPAITGIFVDICNPLIFFTSIAIVMILAALPLLLVNLNQQAQNSATNTKTGSNKTAGFAASLHYMKSTPWLIVLGVVSALQSGSWLAAFRLMGAHHCLTLFHSASTWGSIVSIFNIGMIVGSLLCKYIVLHYEILYSILLPGFLSIPLLIFALNNWIALFLCSAFIAGIIFDATIVYGQTALLDGIPTHILGATTTFTSIMEQCGIIVGYASVLAWGNLNSSLFIMIASGVILVSTGIALWIIQTRKQTYPSMLTKDYWTPSTWVKRSI
ncbi:MFS transporter [Gardnerella leopoldii]|uniref:MFS transporter n=1 Tax=Gardnerella leopoldii TaxID=2792978 RepID=UPI003970A0D9